MKKLYLVLSFALACFSSLMAQREVVKNNPYADMKLFHLGFFVGMHSQDLLLTNSGVNSNGEVWYGEIPSYTPGFSVGVIGDLYLNQYFNLRLSPSIHFGDKEILFKEEVSDEEFYTKVRSNYLTIPLDVKYSALRINNYRPYLLAGVYGAVDLGRKKDNPILLKGIDYGVEFGVGCDIYLPFFKLCPELKFVFGLADLLEKDRGDITDIDLLKYPNALSKATSRMVVLSFNFE